MKTKITEKKKKKNNSLQLVIQKHTGFAFCTIKHGCTMNNNWKWLIKKKMDSAAREAAFLNVTESLCLSTSHWNQGYCLCELVNEKSLK